MIYNKNKNSLEMAFLGKNIPWNDIPWNDIPWKKHSLEKTFLEMTFLVMTFLGINFLVALYSRRSYSILSFFENRLKIPLAKSYQFEMLKYCLSWNGFFWNGKYWITPSKKNFIGLKFCMELDISTADENLIKWIKKYKGKKIPW
jgi:hypothetical protein